MRIVADSKTIQDIRVLWADIFGRPIGDEENFFAIGGDSLSAVNLVLALQKQRNVQIELEAFFADPTIAGLARCCAACEAPAGSHASRAVASA
jgi:acyl carrier protein